MSKYKKEHSHMIESMANDFLLLLFLRFFLFDLRSIVLWAVWRETYVLLQKITLNRMPMKLYIARKIIQTRYAEWTLSLSYFALSCCFTSGSSINQNYGHPNVKPLVKLRFVLIYSNLSIKLKWKAHG